MATDPPHKAPDGILIRKATGADLQGMADLFYTSFYPSHKFWQYLMPDTPRGRAFWHEAWRLGIEEDPTTATFVAVDPAAGGRIVGFSRWVVPQADGNLKRLWPELLPEWDMEVMDAFFAGMADNRKELVGGERHWFLEMLGVDQDYQRRGIAYALLEWGSRQADQEGIRTYLDASMKGLPWYKKTFGFEAKKPIIIPDRPEFGSYVYTSVIRPVPASTKSASG